MVHPGRLWHGVRGHHLVPGVVRRLRGQLCHAAARQELLVPTAQRGRFQHTGRAGARLAHAHHAHRPGKEEEEWWEGREPGGGRLDEVQGMRMEEGGGRRRQRDWA